MIRLENIINLIKKNNGEVKFVGGVVRDFLIENKYNKYKDFRDYIKKNIDILDIDLTVNLKPDKIFEIFEPIARVKKTMATNLVIYKGLKVEITTFRKDIKCFGRNAEFEYADNIYDDSLRRDFTINALYSNIDGNIIDYHNGIEDLKNSKVKFIGNAETRIKEDYLRILRFFRFCAKFNSIADKKTLEVCKKNINGLSHLSIERIISEIYKLILYKNADESIKSMEEYGVLNKILPNIIIDKEGLNVKNKINCNDSNVIFLAIIYNSTNEFEILPKNWIFTNNDKSLMKFYKLNKNLVIKDQNKENIRFMLLSYNKNMIIRCLDLMCLIKEISIEKYKNLKDFIEQTKVPSIPINGEVIVDILKKKDIEKNKIKDVYIEIKKEFAKRCYNMTNEEIIDFALSKVLNRIQ